MEPSELPYLTEPLIFGYVFSFMLFGVLCVQVFIYFISFPKDTVNMKAYVYLVFFIEVAITALATYEAWWVFGEGYSDPTRILRLRYKAVGQVSQLPLSAFLMSLVHGFYSWRIWIMTKRIVIPAVTCAISAVGLGLALYSTVYISQQSKTMGSLAKLHSISAADLACAASADVLITATMLFVLLRARKDAFYHTVHTLEKIIKFTAETGMITSLAVITSLIIYVTGQNTKHSYLYIAL
jgi:hypothetical protein